MQAAEAGAATRDSDIVQLLQTGQCDRAFAMLLHRYESKVHRLCCALLRDRGLAEDAAQESLVRVWKGLGSYDSRASLSSWIYAITRNRCLTALTKIKTVVSLDESQLVTGARHQPPLTDAPPESRAGELRELVDRLPERLRRALVLYYYEERSVGEVALMLGCPEGTVKTCLFRARAALTRELRRCGLDDPLLWLEDAS